ncbi:hypothetical protein [Kocuria marina]|uniref:hypothetical protein n=1 Tax=Kocuria marina TaxID=223184 RepID=UPI0022E8CC31|nr:hypothetical protein [Kocuria marina]
MALSVTPCGNGKTWDARVRVTGGHPELLWGIGDAEALTAQDARVERVAVDRGQQTVGYGQLVILREDLHTVVDARSLHVKDPRHLTEVLAALQDHARTAHEAAVLRVSPDTEATPELTELLTGAGYRRTDKPRKGEAGPRHLVVRLGETEGELSKRLSDDTLQRCRAGLRDSGVRVRRVRASDRDLSNVGLRSEYIRELLRAVGENSVFLVATEHLEDGTETALGYLWFVHTGESAMIYRLGFTARARQLGVDDALLLTGLVQLQQRQVHKVLAGDPDRPSQPMVLRELATEEHEAPGTWEYPLLGEFQVAGRVEKTRRRFLGRRPKDTAPDDLLPEQPAVRDDDAAPARATSPAAPERTRSRSAASEAVTPKTAAPETAAPLSPSPGFGFSDDRPTARTDGYDAAPPSRATPGVDADPDLVRSADAVPGGAEHESDAARSSRASRGGRIAGLLPGPLARRKRSTPSDASPSSGTPSGGTRSAGTPTTGAPATDRNTRADSWRQSAAAGLVRRAVEEGRAAVRDAARW